MSDDRKTPLGQVNRDAFLNQSDRERFRPFEQSDCRELWERAAAAVVDEHERRQRERVPLNIAAVIENLNTIGIVYPHYAPALHEAAALLERLAASPPAVDAERGWEHVRRLRGDVTREIANAAAAFLESLLEQRHTPAVDAEKAREHVEKLRARAKACCDYECDRCRPMLNAAAWIETLLPAKAKRTAGQVLCQHLLDELVTQTHWDDCDDIDRQRLEAAAARLGIAEGDQ